MTTTSSTQNTEIKRTRPEEIETLGDNLIWIDVRTPAEFGEVHIDGAKLHPLSELDVEKVSAAVGDGKPCVLVCRSGNRATKAAEQLAGAGVGNLHVLDGGVQAWQSAGMPVIQGKKVMSLERQVRIAAGALVFIGTLLGVTVASGFFIIPAFVGAGLVFAGITDTCGMGMMLAKMPWNQRGSGPEASSCRL